MPVVQSASETRIRKDPARFTSWPSATHTPVTVIPDHIFQQRFPVPTPTTSTSSDSDDQPSSAGAAVDEMRRAMYELRRQERRQRRARQEADGFMSAPAQSDLVDFRVRFPVPEPRSLDDESSSGEQASAVDEMRRAMYELRRKERQARKQPKEAAQFRSCPSWAQGAADAHAVTAAASVPESDVAGTTASARAAVHDTQQAADEPRSDSRRFSDKDMRNSMASATTMSLPPLAEMSDLDDDDESDYEALSEADPTDEEDMGQTYRLRNSDSDAEALPSFQNKPNNLDVWTGSSQVVSL